MKLTKRKAKIHNSITLYEKRKYVVCFHIPSLANYTIMIGTREWLARVFHGVLTLKNWDSESVMSQGAYILLLDSSLFWNFKFHYNIFSFIPIIVHWFYNNVIYLNLFHYLSLIVIQFSERIISKKWTHFCIGSWKVTCIMRKEFLENITAERST